MGIREDVFADWMDVIRDKVGHELLRKQMWPPKQYFGQRTRPRRAANLRAAVPDSVMVQ